MKAKAPFLRTAYNYDMNDAGDESALMCVDPTLAQQQFRDECDINVIVDRFGLNGELPSGVRMPTYGDFFGVDDFHTAANAIAMANESFDAMPAKVRARFNNDPAEFVDFCSKAENRQQAIDLGLVLPQAAALAEGAPDPLAKPVLPPKAESA